MEIWEIISGFAYKVSDSGKVWSIRNNREIKSYKSNGYLKVDLYNNWIRKKVYVHQLVAQNFLGESYFDGAIVNHKDGVKSNNKVSNLEWATYSDNLNHSYRVLFRKRDKPKGSNSWNARKIMQMTIDGNFIKEFGSIIDAQNEFGTCIERCLAGKNKTAYGYKWKYA